MKHLRMGCSKKTYGKDASGFTLVEVLVSLTAMAIGMVLLWGMHFSSVRMEMSDQRRAEALKWAGINLDRLRTEDDNACLDWNATMLVRTKVFPPGVACTALNTPAAWQRRTSVIVAWRERARPMGQAAQTQSVGSVTHQVQLSSIFDDTF